MVDNGTGLEVDLVEWVIEHATPGIIAETEKAEKERREAMETEVRHGEIWLINQRDGTGFCPLCGGLFDNWQSHYWYEIKLRRR